MTFDDVFDDKGNLSYDPYRLDEEVDLKHAEQHKFLFEDGFLRDFNALEAWVSENWSKLTPSSDAVLLLGAQSLARHTKGAYPTYYLFR